MLEQLDEKECWKKIKAKEMAGMEGHLLVFDHVVTFETLGLKPFRDEVDGLGMASMAVVRVPDAGEFLLSLFDHLQDPPHEYGGIDVECQGTPTIEMLKAFLIACASCLTEAQSMPTTGRPLGLGDVKWVSPAINPAPPGFEGDGTRTPGFWESIQ